MSKRIEERGWICMEQWRWDSEPHFIFRPGEERPAPLHDDCVTRSPVMEHTLVFNLPAGFDPRPDQIAALEEQKRELAAKYQAAVTEINARISKLQAIEYAA